MKCVPVKVKGDGAEACANCGSVSIGTVKLTDCPACRLVKYCGVDCQRAHRKQHKKECEQRFAELEAKDEQLYSQGHERPEGDFCPICTLPIQLPMGDHSGFNICCMQRICDGCHVAAQKKGIVDCVFCRTPFVKNDADALVMTRARVAKKDPAAINDLAEKYFYGELGLQQNTRKAIKLWTEAAELGSIVALCHLGTVYYGGDTVQEDKAKGVEFLKRAAMQGDVLSRRKLGAIEACNGSALHAVRHFLISAKMGDKDSLDLIRKVFMAGGATKAQYAEALKGYQDAVEETKSPQRDEAKDYSKNRFQYKLK